MKWLDPAAQARLKAFALALRRPAGGGAAGKHRALARGLSREFSHHRAYDPGDEARSIDWKAFARLDRPVVRTYRSEQRLSVCVLLDASGSMGYAGEGREPKLDAARRVAAALAWLALEQGDEAGLVVFDKAVRKELAPRSGMAWLPEIDAALDAAAPGGETGLASALDAAAARLPRRGLVALVSDLQGEPESVLAAAARLRARRHELLVLQVLDPDELAPPWEGPVVLEGLEGGELPFDAAEHGEAYRRAAARRQEAYAAAFRHGGSPFACAVGPASWEAALERALAA